MATTSGTEQEARERASTGQRVGDRNQELTRRRWLVGAAAAGLAANRLGALAAAQPTDVSWLADAQRRPDPLPGNILKLAPIVDDRGEAITSLEPWRQRRGTLRKEWLDVLGPLASRRIPVPVLKTLAEDRVEGVVRRLVSYEIEPGVTTEAFILEPGQDRGPRAGVAVFHSTVDASIRQPAGVEGAPEKAFGLRLAKRGCTTICPRNFLWPDNHHISANEETRTFQGRHPDSLGMAKMLYDAIVAVDILLSLPRVDPKRIGAVGHSLGAKEVLYLAAFDERVRVTVSSEGGIGLPFTNWDAPWYLGPQVKSGSFGREHHQLLALAAPRPFLLVGGGSADGDPSWPFIEAALPIYRLYGEPPRLALFNHRQGHAVPPIAEQRIDEWLSTYLER
ncbi:MAG: dienelactone hydrolase [Planctomycetes bacterium]|nr:dienelactone hydrolase [Planctomycetota bacterium]